MVNRHRQGRQGRGTGSAVRLVDALSAWDRGVFRHVTAREWPRADALLPRLSRGADHSKLWMGLAAGIAASGVGGPRARKGALRGLVSLAAASAVVNTVGKGAVRRTRPVLDDVPAIRQLKRLPRSTSFPSGHSASAAAFATGVALESRGWGAVLAPVAAAVAFSRVYTGVHYPSDVLTGAAIGAASAFVVRTALDSRQRRRTPPAQPLVEAPALPEGHGLFVVANPGSGSAAFSDEIGHALPEAEVTVWDESEGTLVEVMEQHAKRAAQTGGALGVFGGDGTVNVAACAALQHRVPLAVLPGGTFNHLAQDLGIATCEDTAQAVDQGHAVALDLARFTPGPDPTGGGGPGHFVNTFSLGAYGDMVEVRERWSARIGPWGAGLLAALHVTRRSRPFEAVINGQRRSLWLLFVGNCSYAGPGSGSTRRFNVADGSLDVHLIRGGRWARTRLLAAGVVGLLHRSPVHSAARTTRLRLDGITEGTLASFDGEIALASRQLLLDKETKQLTVYRPLPAWLSGRTLPVG